MSSPEGQEPCQQCNLQAAAKALDNLDKVLIAAHVNPDGDAVGAMAACGWILKNLGKTFAIYAPGGIPDYLSFLELPGKVYANLAELPFEPKGAIYVDCSDPMRLGPELEAHPRPWPSINIDHHLASEGLGTAANFIDHKAAATCQLAAKLAEKLKMPLASPLGDAIALGLLTDTGQFCHENATAEVFDLAAKLERAGVRLAKTADKLNHVWTLRRLHIWGKCFLNIHITSRGKVAWTLLTREDITRQGIGKTDMEGYVDMLRKIVGVYIGVFGRETDSGQTRFSLRSHGDIDVQKIAASLGGGGHRNAAGITISSDGDSAMDMVLDACEAYLEEYARK